MLKEEGIKLNLGIFSYMWRCAWGFFWCFDDATAGAICSPKLILTFCMEYIRRGASAHMPIRFHSGGCGGGRRRKFPSVMWNKILGKWSEENALLSAGFRNERLLLGVPPPTCLHECVADKDAHDAGTALRTRGLVNTHLGSPLNPDLL